MAEYTTIITVLDRLISMGLQRHVAERHLRYGRVTVGGQVVTDPLAHAPAPHAVAVRTTSTVA